MSYFILADCNNFYASCERLFNPRLEGKPVVVLSNNDGCVIARSQEAKDLGIKMGDPYFKIKEFCFRARILAYSSNFQLYGDISRRIMNIYAEEEAEIEVYSIDEAFLKYPASLTPEEVVSVAKELRNKVKRWVGIPVSLGIGPTKVLAKVANNLAKQNKTIVFDLSAQEVRNEIFRSYPVGEIWGIGSRFRERLNRMGIYTAADFLNSDPTLIRKKMGVVGERMLWELRGVSCLDLEEDSSKKSITCSRSFGQVLTDERQIAEALSAFTANGCVKLRKQKCCAKALYVFLETTQTNDQGFKRLHFNEQVTFAMPTNDTSEIIAAAKKCLKRLYQPHIRYKKCGITLIDLTPEGNVGTDLFLKPKNPKRKLLMQTMDELNRQWGKESLFFGSMGVNPQWKARREHLSFYNTTSWEHLPLVKTQ